ncbi:proton-conducting transporter membrane subunit [Mucilaginibacter sp. L3T2-6]|uniref:proton-conducting transporter transmembrane domain-containing protein n=1 Tax=Mucilaginibacter sp. L3T2-6 TaxID=3062491 RepID=UPI002674E36B|nr:proton-conducting transporter membrane subunit [Mucilaginibacter sp. L3T2-6]MDO3641358.1 proton-conducting transporter membrane subunit [Mucilaginibacter sp. L3T2-6]MDV6213881.1 proton-conducting transporter membrane subunit [Mucilaginibacter sp. L3T2-6]
MIEKTTDFTKAFHADKLSLILIGLVTFVTLSVGSFSVRYLKGDRRQKGFFLNLAALVIAVFLMVCADNIFLLLASWTISNILLARLMLHKGEWKAAKQSSILALKNFALGFAFLAAALIILYRITGETSIQAILIKPIGFKWSVACGVLILLAAMSQSAIWPFHRWLTSSLNSPTPVSAIMHAGLVNGGGFLFVRFAPMLANEPLILNVIFIAGIATALLGTLWKLMQSDVKRMLACSTMGQMGFMIAQCGLGLFPAAVAHLCWHGLFKAYLFLASGSAAKEKRLDLDYPPSFKDFSMALVCGVLAAYMFSVASGKHLLVADTTLFLTFLSMIAGTQFVLPVIRGHAKAKLLLAVAASVFAGAFYGLNVRIIELMLEPLKILVPQPLNILHFIAAVLLLISWLSMLFLRLRGRRSYPGWLLFQYVQMLNASQPHPKTITANRNEYQF